MKDKAPKTERYLLQVRLSDNEKRNIKMMAAGQGLTLREATLAAFTAWAEAPRAGRGCQSGQSCWAKVKRGLKTQDFFGFTKETATSKQPDTCEAQ
jgi:hypothetical protein